MLFDILVGCLVFAVFLIPLLIVFMMIDVISDSYEEFYNRTSFWACALITFCFCITFAIFTTPYKKRIELAEIKVNYEYNLNNILNLANNMNEKVVVKTESDRIIIDVANLSQSTTTSSVYIGYVDNVNKYNLKLAEFKTKGGRGFLNRLFYGLYPEVPEEIKFVKIKL